VPSRNQRVSHINLNKQFNLLSTLDLIVFERLDLDWLQRHFADTTGAAEAYSTARVAVSNAVLRCVLRSGRGLGSCHVFGRLERPQRQLNVCTQHLEANVQTSRNMKINLL
jgi:hypothetical protein